MKVQSKYGRRGAEALRNATLALTSVIRATTRSQDLKLSAPQRLSGNPAYIVSAPLRLCGENLSHHVR